MTRKNIRGFTTIELIIVMIIICALSSVIYVTYKELRIKEQDTRRKDDLTLLQRQLESYQAQYGNYPTLGDLNNTLWRGKYLKNFDASILQDPLGSSAKLVAAPKPKAYAYIPTPEGCNNEENGQKGVLCTGYSLTATLENGSGYVEKNFN